MAWPGWPFLRFAWLLSAANTGWFALIYAGSDWLTAQRSLRVVLHHPGELQIPLVPAAVVFYLSIYALFFLGPFVLRDRRSFTVLSFALAIATLVGGVGFLLFPSEPAYPPPEVPAKWVGIFRFADRLNLRFNMLPSLHVALSVCCVSAFVPNASPLGRGLLWLWAATIAASTLLTHQHHVLDVITGAMVGILSLVAARMLYRS